jgi:[protein-PII] uridylyltransferase
VLVLAPDRPRLFADLAQAFSSAGANVIDARVHTSRTGQAFDIFALQDQSGAAFGQDRGEIVERLKARILDVLRAEPAAANAAARVYGTARAANRAAAFAIEPLVMFDNDGAGNDTIVEVSGRDRPGLLAELASVFDSEGVNITSAHIDSVGERATDAFYVRDRGGLKLIEPRQLDDLRGKLETVLGASESGIGPTLVAKRTLARARSSSRR